MRDYLNRPLPSEYCYVDIEPWHESTAWGNIAYDTWFTTKIKSLIKRYLPDIWN